MLISIITVVINDQEGLKRTIDSLKSLDTNYFEHIIVDGNSKDETVSTIESYNYSNLVYISEPDNGIYDAMNKGIRLSKGKYITFLNAGDTALSDFFYVPRIIQEKSYDFYYSGIIFEGKKKYKYLPKKFNKNTEYLQKMPFSHPGLFVKSTLFNSIGLFDIRKKITADHEWIVRMLNSKKEGKLMKIFTVNFELNGSSLSINSIIEMFQTSLKYNRNKIRASIFFVYGVLIFLYYKYIK